MRKIKGKLIVVDGIDGSGKGTVVEYYKKYFLKKRKKILDLKDYWRKKHSLPEPRDLEKYEVIISAEPTFSLIGLAIRDEIVRHNERTYSALATAQAFSLDRFILYQRVIIPCLKEGKIIVQERGVSTSLVYQPVQKESLSLRKILDLEGNKLALKFRPDFLIITTVEPDVAIKRLEKRKKKQDFAIFEREDFLRKIQSRFKAKWFKNIFEKRGTKILYLDTSGSLKDLEKKVLDILKSYKYEI